jgi:preprotein translocase subunit SecY
MNSAGMGELFARLRFVLIALLIYRVGTHIPVPGIDPEQLSALFDQNQGTILGLANVFSGGALERMSILALGILPYISASIIMQLMTAVTPQLEQLKKEGEAGRRKISQWTRYLTVVLALVQGSGMTVGLANQGLTYVTGFSFYVTAVASLVTGAVFMMWLGEQITERGVGNGISLLIFAGIVAGLPAAIGQSLEQARQGEISILILLGILVLAAVVIYLVVFIERGTAPHHGELRKTAAGPQDDASASVAFALKSEHGWGYSGYFCQLHFIISRFGRAMVWQRRQRRLVAGFGGGDWSRSAVKYFVVYWFYRVLLFFLHGVNVQSAGSGR